MLVNYNQIMQQTHLTSAAANVNDMYRQSTNITTIGNAMSHPNNVLASQQQSQPQQQQQQQTAV